MMPFLAVVPAFSQEGGLGLTAAVMGVFPSGKMDRVVSSGFGGLGGLELSGDGFGVSARSGYIQLGERDGMTQSMVPILGGLKISTEDGGVYLAGELGAVMTHREYSGPSLVAQNTRKTNPGWSVGVGSNPGPLDLRFSFNVWDTRNLQESMSIGLSLGVVIR